MKKYYGQILVLVLALTLISGTALANNVNIVVNQTTNVQWEEGTNGKVIASGEGIAPPNATGAQARVLARRAAIVDAQRNLLENIQGVQLDANTTMEMLMITSDVVRTRVSGMLKGAVIISESSDGDSYRVTMGINMYGPSSVAAIAFTSLKPAEIQPFPQPAPSYRQPASGRAYTGLIIVAKNMGLKSTFSPRVYDESGSIIYGNKYIDPDFAIANGMVDYSNLDAASRGNSRAGNNPLVINAIRTSDHNFNLVISNEDAQKVLAAQAQSGFMRQCAVVFARN